MKPPPPPLSPAKARNCLLLNQFATPGLGSLLGRRLVAGMGQLAAAVVGFVLFCAWVLVALWFLRRRRKGDIPRAVVSLIAGISLLDALLIAGAGFPGLALAALAGFGVTLFLQRYLAGT